MEQEDYIGLIEECLNELQGFSSASFSIYGFEDYNVVRDIVENSSEHSEFRVRNRVVRVCFNA